MNLVDERTNKGEEKRDGRYWYDTWEDAAMCCESLIMAINNIVYTDFY